MAQTMKPVEEKDPTVYVTKTDAKYHAEPVADISDQDTAGSMGDEDTIRGREYTCIHIK